MIHTDLNIKQTGNKSIKERPSKPNESHTVIIEEGMGTIPYQSAMSMEMPIVDMLGDDTIEEEESTLLHRESL